MSNSLQSKPENYRWWVLVVVMIGTLMGALDQSIVNVSIPVIMADFGSPVDEIEWVITGYMLAFSTLMPLTAWLRNRMGHKQLYIASLFIFVLGSVLCGLSWNLPSLIAARVIQAFGGGALTPIAMTMIADIFSPAERGKALGYWGVGVIVGPAFGPTLGGYITHYFGWRSIFLVNLPIGIIGIMMASAILIADRPSKEDHTPFDFWGFLFLTVFLISSLLGLSKGESKGWHSSYIITCAILAFFSFIFFLVVELHTTHGIMDLRLFLLPVFTSAIFITIIRSVALFGALFLLPLFLQVHMGIDEIESGLILLPGALIIAVAMPLAGKISDTIGPRVPAIFGLICVSASMFLYYDLDKNTSIWHIIYPTLIRGVGLGFLMAPVSATSISSVPRSKTAMSSSMTNLIQQVAGSIGIAVLSTIMSHRTLYHLSVIGENANTLAPYTKELYHRALELGLSHAQSLMIATQKITIHVASYASIHGVRDAFIVGASLILLAVIPAFVLPAKPLYSVSKADKEMTIME